METPLRIGAVAKLSGVAIDTVRYYERRGVLSDVPRRRSGYREFSGSAVERIRFAKHLQALGFTLDEVVALLRAVDAGSAQCSSERRRFERVLARVDERLAELKSIRRSLVKTIRSCEAGECSLLDQVASEGQRVQRRATVSKSGQRRVGRALP